MVAQRGFTSYVGRYDQRQRRAQLQREGYKVGRQCLRGWLSTSGQALCTRADTRPPRTTKADPQAVAATNKLVTWPASTTPTKSRSVTSPTWP